MAFQLYERERASADDEVISISTVGLIVFSAPVTEKYLSTDFVLLYFDSETQRVGVKPAKQGEPNAYKLTQPKNSKRKNISGRGFLNKNKINQTGDEKTFVAKTYPVTFENGMVIFKV